MKTKFVCTKCGTTAHKKMYCGLPDCPGLDELQYKDQDQVKQENNEKPEMSLSPDGCRQITHKGKTWVFSNDYNLQVMPTAIPTGAWKEFSGYGKSPHTTVPIDPWDKFLKEKFLEDDDE